MKKSLSLLCMLGALSACGGHDDDDAPAPAPMPTAPAPDPTAATDQFTVQVASLVAAQPEDAEPAALDASSATMPEDTEPAPVKP